MGIKINHNKTYTSYEVNVYLPKHIQEKLNCERLYKTFYNKEKAEKWYKKKKNELRTGNIFIPSKNTIKDVWEEYYEFEVKKNKLSVNTLQGYKIALEKHIIPILENKSIDNLSRFDFNKLNTELDKTNLSEKSKYNIISSFKTILRFAQKRNYIEEIPFNDFIKYSQSPTKETDIFETKDQFISLLKEINNVIVKDIIKFTFFTGCRIGEVIGLKCNQINLSKNEILISNQVIYKNRKFIEKKPKCNIISPIRINNIVKEIILKYMIGKNEGDFLFSDENNKPFRCDGIIRYHYNNAVKTLKEKGFIGKDKKITIHSLRHSYATMLNKFGEPIGNISSLLRHKNYSTTDKTYVHRFNAVNPISFAEIEKEFNEVNSI